MSVTISLPNGGTKETRDKMTLYRNASGVLHREDGPALMRADGSEVWRINGELHRVGGPASITPKHKMWAERGRIHRLDGPASVYADGREEWYIHAKRREDLDDIVGVGGVAALEVTVINSEHEHNKYTYRCTNEAGQLHREDGPAIWTDTGRETYYQNGLIHRADGPAVVRRGSSSWYVHDHYVNWPNDIIDNNDGSFTWEYDGRQISTASESTLVSALSMPDSDRSRWRNRLDRLVFDRLDIFQNGLIRVYTGPGPGCGFGEVWLLGGKLHRVDGPAVSYVSPDNGLRAELWVRHGVLHCEDGPALRESVEIVDNAGNTLDVVLESWYYEGEKHHERE